MRSGRSRSRWHALASPTRAIDPMPVSWRSHSWRAQRTSRVPRRCPCPPSTPWSISPQRASVQTPRCLAPSRRCPRSLPTPPTTPGPTCPPSRQRRWLRPHTSTTRSTRLPPNAPPVAGPGRSWLASSLCWWEGAPRGATSSGASRRTRCPRWLACRRRRRSPRWSSTASRSTSRTSGRTAARRATCCARIRLQGRTFARGARSCCTSRVATLRHRFQRTSLG